MDGRRKKQATLFAYGVQSKETSGSRQSSSACPAGVPDVVDVEDGSEGEEPTEADAAEERAVTEVTSEYLVVRRFRYRSHQILGQAC